MGCKIGKLLGKSEDMRILLAGLDGAGKTTVLYTLQLGEVTATIPTIGYNVETIKWGNMTFTAWDVGYRSIVGPLIGDYFANTRAVIYVIDSDDHERLSEARDDLQFLCKDNQLRDSLILVFANKQDLPNAKSPLAISEALGLHIIRQHWHIIPTVAKTGDGLAEGLEWVVHMLNKRHLPKDCEELTLLNESKPNSKSDDFFSYSWKYFYSIFQGSKECRISN